MRGAQSAGVVTYMPGGSTGARGKRSRVPRGALLVGTRPQRGGGGLYGPQNCHTEQCALSAPEALEILF